MITLHPLIFYGFVIIMPHLLFKCDEFCRSLQTGQLLNIAAKNQALIQDYKSISMIFLVAFEIRFEDKEAMKTLGLRGFEILKTLQQNREEKSYSYAVCKNMIALQRLIGLQ